MSDNKDLDGNGLRKRLEIAGENYYLVATRNVTDNGIDFTVTVPDENRPVGRARRETAERICAACSELSRRI
jgi:hypothetical protein